MDSRKKILLGSQDTVPKLDEDNFVSVELQRNYRELWPNSYYNDFNIFQQFQKERDDARNFVFYGIIDSNKEDTENILFSASFINDSGDTVYRKTLHSNTLIPPDPGIEISRLTPPQFGGYNNIYGFQRGKYKVDLTKDEFATYPDITSVVFSFSGSQTPVNSFKKQFIFYDEFLNLNSEYEKKLISFGTQSVETNPDGSTFEVDNNFPFFYKAHWIKTNFDIKSEIVFANTETPYITFSIQGEGVLSQLAPPSPGVEATDVIYSLNPTQTYDLIFSLNGALANGNEVITIDAEIVDDSVFANIHPSPFAPGTTLQGIPITVVFNSGETEKRIPITIQQDFGMNYPTSIARFRVLSVENCLISPYNQNNSNVIRIAETPEVTMVMDGAFTENANWRIYPVVKGEVINIISELSEIVQGGESVSMFLHGASDTTTYDTSNFDFNGFNPYEFLWDLGDTQQKTVNYNLPIEFSFPEEIKYLFFDLSAATNCEISTFNLAKRIVIQPINKKIKLSFYDEITQQDGNEIYITKSPGDQITFSVDLSSIPHGSEQVNLVNEGISENGNPLSAFLFPELNPKTVFWSTTNAEPEILIPYTVPGNNDLLTPPISPLTKINFLMENFEGGTEMDDYNTGKTLSIRLA